MTCNMTALPAATPNTIPTGMARKMPEAATALSAGPTMALMLTKMALLTMPPPSPL
jgi:hypothetical protein